MNKFRILTTDGEWVYSQIEVLGNRIVCPLCNENGAQFLKPNLEFRPETLGYSTNFVDKYDKELFDGDIINEYVSGIALIEWDKKESIWKMKWKDNLTLLAFVIPSLEIIGNIHQNPELVEEK